MARHSAAFLARLQQHREISAEEFDKIDRIDYARPFAECMDLAEHILMDVTTVTPPTA
ncbi:MAG: hypothetical protein V4706_12275 [Pseudomonadota bacterium]